jgi:hypothetical protein
LFVSARTSFIASASSRSWYVMNASSAVRPSPISARMTSRSCGATEAP